MESLTTDDKPKKKPMNHWHKKHIVAFPSPSQILRLCEIFHIDVHKALKEMTKR